MDNKNANIDILFYESFSDLLLQKGFLWKNNMFVKLHKDIFYSVRLVCDEVYGYDVMVSGAPIFCNMPDDKSNRSLSASMKKTGLLLPSFSEFLNQEADLGLLMNKYCEICRTVYSGFFAFDSLREYADYILLFLFRQIRTTDIYSNRIFDDSLNDMNIFDVVYTLYRTNSLEDGTKKMMGILSLIGEYFYGRIEVISSIVKDKAKYEAEMMCVNTLKSDYDSIRTFLQAVFEDNRAYLFTINSKYEEIEKKNREYLKSLDLL